LELSLKAFFKSAFSGNFRVADSSPVTSYNAVLPNFQIADYWASNRKQGAATLQQASHCDEDIREC
jgi:hypothetical protein